MDLGKLDLDILCYLIDPRNVGKNLNWTIMAQNVGATRDEVGNAIHAMQKAKIISKTWGRPLEIIDYPVYERAKAMRVAPFKPHVCQHCHGTGLEP